MIFVDTNILVDLADRDSRFAAWSRRMTVTHGVAGMATNHVVLAEFSGRFASAQTMTDWIAAANLTLLPFDAASAYAAGAAFRRYLRLREGPRVTMIADFLIGAHAATLGFPLLTRDVARFASYFPELTLITPETHP